MRQCPSRQQLIRFAALGQADDDAVTQHVSGCATCQSFVTRISAMTNLAGAYEAFVAPSAGSAAVDRVPSTANQLFEQFHATENQLRLWHQALLMTRLRGAAGGWSTSEAMEHLVDAVVAQYPEAIHNVLGDVLLLAFGHAQRAARCAWGFERLSESLRPAASGLHFSAIVARRRTDAWEIEGRGVSVVAEIQAIAETKHEPLLCSAAFRASLPSHASFYFEPVDDTELLRLHQLTDADPAVSPRTDIPPEQMPLVLAAQTQSSTSDQQVAGDGPAACHCLLLEPETGRGFVIPVRVHVRPGQAPGIRCRGSADKIMRAAATRAVESAFEQMRQLGFKDARAEHFEIDWWMDDLSIRYEGASLGLAIALTTVAAYTGVSINPALSVTGGVDGNRVVGVEGVGAKWAALKDTSRFQTMLLPSANMPEMPPTAPKDNQLRVVPVDSLRSAVAEVFGSALGLATTAFADAETNLAKQSDRVEIQLWVRRDERRSSTRDISVISESPETSFSIGDQIRIGAQVDRDCHLALVNVGSTGNVTILWPNSNHPESAVSARLPVFFPSDSDAFSFRLEGPAGRERIIAIASRTPLLLTPRQFHQINELCASPTTRDITVVAESLNDRVVGFKELQFFVTGTVQSNRDALRSISPTDAESKDFQSFELG